MRSFYRLVGIVSMLGFILVTSGCQGAPKTHSLELKPADLYGFPTAAEVQSPDTSLTNEAFLRSIASDTWEYFEAAVERQSELPIDYLWFDQKRVGPRTSITNIGLYMLAVITAWDLNLINRDQAVEHLQRTLKTVAKLDTYHGFHYNWYDLKTLQPAEKFISTVDAGWFYASVSIVEQTFPAEFGEICTSLLNKVDFNWLFDPTIGHFRHGFNVDTKTFSPYHYSIMCSESRIVSYLALSRNEAPASHWQDLYTALPDSVQQQQVPETINGIGYYRYKDLWIIPAWGGSLFEYLMPSLLMDEMALAPQGLGANNRRALKVHIDYALKEKNYPVWGLSPSTTPTGDYGVFGVPVIGCDIGGYPPTIVSPHASVLAINYDAAAVIKNLKQLLIHYPIYGEFGFYDCVDPLSGKVGQAYLTLDQAMIFISIGNYFTSQALPQRFQSLPGMDTVIDLIGKDIFSPNQTGTIED